MYYIATTCNGLNYTQPLTYFAPTPSTFEYTVPCKKEEGNNPMRDYDFVAAPTASASIVQQTKSDAAIQRDYLMKRLEKVSQYYGPKYDELRDLFNLNADPGPKTARELLDMIKGGKFKLDEKKLDLADSDIEYDEDGEYTGNVFYGIEWDGPKPDRVGYQEALKEFEKAVVDARDTITIKDPEDGLKALKALEAWTPKGKKH